ncbi:MAG TPA: hypothetical protein VM617_06260 [Thermoanaerobaculia bacterium]|nr:hypothetical protein [Thermoanaerobaculia bacterium]
MTSRGLVGELQGFHGDSAERHRLLQQIGRVVDACSPFGRCFPAGNGPALAAWYLGVLALVPLFGALAAGPAVACGVTGRHRARLLPGQEGGVHAWAGLILGVVAGAANLSWAVVWLAAL